MNARRAAALAKTKPLPERFWEKVNKEAANGCWEWTGAKDGRGYGMFCIHDKIVRRAHRVALMLVGRAPEDWDRKAATKPDVVDHICQNRCCVRPDHLRLVPQAVNSVENTKRGPPPSEVPSK